LFKRRDEGMALAREQNLVGFDTFTGQMWVCETYLNAGMLDEAYLAGKTCVDWWYGNHGSVCGPYARTIMGAARGRQGDIAEGLALIDQALTEQRETGDQWYYAEAHRLKGELLLAGSDADPGTAEVCFQKAIDIAQAQSAKGWELRAATSLARLWYSQNKTKEAYELLFPVYDWFTEGFDTADLKEAKELLDELE